MNLDELEKMAQQTAAFGVHPSGEFIYSFYTEQLQAFARLVAEHERDRIAQKIEQLPFGDTSASFAIYVRECPPCNGNCNQGRTCPARK